MLADEPVQPLQPRPVRGMRLAVPTTVALDDLDEEVSKIFERALETLSRAGALIERIEVPGLGTFGLQLGQRLERGPPQRHVRAPD